MEMRVIETQIFILGMEMILNLMSLDIILVLRMLIIH
mgnify:CR=1 FL=1